MANRAIVYRIYPNKGQETLLQKTFGCVRFVYNHMLSLQEERYKAGEKYLPRTAANNYCNQELKEEYPFLREPDKFALTNAVFHMDAAYQAMFGHRGKHPKYKSKHYSKKSYTTNISNGNIAVGDGHVKLPKLGRVKAATHRMAPEGWALKSATVSQGKDGTYQVSVLYEYESTVLPMGISGDNTIGLDFKMSGLYVASDGTQADMPGYYRRAQKRLAREQRRLSRKQKDSKNRNKQRIRLARVHAHVANQRKDFLHKQSAAIAKQYTCVCVEDLDLKAMSDSGFYNGKSVHDDAYGMFLGMLQYKLEVNGGMLVKVGRWYPSSQMCGHCGYKNSELRDLSIRKWACPVCGTVHDRDVNAAENIKHEGLRLLREAA